MGFTWPETPRNTTAYYICPNNANFSVSRECSVEGVWLKFDERGCGVLAEELEMITMTAQDVCISINSSYGILLYTHSFMITLYSQLISGRIEDLVAVLSEAVGNGNEVDQTEANFNVISNTLANVTSFVAESSAMINETVSSQADNRSTWVY